MFRTRAIRIVDYWSRGDPKNGASCGSRADVAAMNVSSADRLRTAAAGGKPDLDVLERSRGKHMKKAVAMASVDAGWLAAWLKGESRLADGAGLNATRGRPLRRLRVGFSPS